MNWRERLTMRINQAAIQPFQIQPSVQQPDVNPFTLSAPQLAPMAGDSFSAGSGLDMAQVFEASNGSNINDILNGLIELGASVAGVATNNKSNVDSPVNQPVTLDSGAAVSDAGANLMDMAGAAITPPSVQNDAANTQLEELLKLLISALLGQNTGAPQADRGNVNAGMPGVSGIQQLSRSAGQADDGEAINSQGNGSLQDSLDKIENDPVGSTLLAKARENGVSIRVGDTGGANINGFFNPNTNEIVVKDPSNIKTIVHELGHAATPHDGNSQEEEGVVEAIGRDVVSRIETGRSLSNQQLQQIANDKRTLYRDLGSNNGIKQSLAELGIAVGIN